MKKKSGFLIITGMAIMALVLAGCSGKKETSSGNNVTQPAINAVPSAGVTNPVAAAFLQFGADLEKVKPNVATPDDANNQNRSDVSSSVYTARAYYRERSNTTISNDVAVEYKERMFNYFKSISADSKCYRLRLSLSEELEEVTTFEDLNNSTGAYDDWSYKFNGMWINAVTLHYSLGDEIGIDLQGIGNY